MPKTINSYIYFYHLDKYCVLPDYPESIVDSMGSDFASTNALARTAPVYTYKYSGPRDVSTVSLSLHRDMMNGLNIGTSNLKDNVVDFSGDDYVDTLLKYLQAAALPRYHEYSSRSKTVIPPMVAIRFGNDIFVKGVITSKITVTYKKPILYNDKYSCADIAFSVSEVDPYDADLVVKEGSFRGITKTFKDGIYNDTTGSPSYSTSDRSYSSTVSSDKYTKTRDNIELSQKKEKFKIPNTGVRG